MEKIKISLIAVIAIVMGIAGSAFNTSTTKVHPTDSNFYKYNSTSTLKADIQNIANYTSSALDCNSGSHVCGVILPTSKAIDQQPETSEFNSQKENLWTSEEDGTSTNSSVIKMRN